MENDEWLACKIKLKDLDRYFAMSRISREWYLEISYKIGHIPTSVVVKVFYNEKEAKKFCDKMNEVDNILKTIL